MCVIIDNSNGSTINRETLDTCLAENSDGYGFICLETGELKKSMTAKSIRRWTKQSKRWIVHCRLATKGKASMKNVHPFRVGNWLVAMNGTISGMACSSSNDTKQVVQQLKFVKEKHYQAFLECFEPKFIAYNVVTGEKFITHADEWHTENDILYSNDRHTWNYYTSKDYNSYYSQSRNSSFNYSTTDSEGLTKIGVYGTLRMGNCNHDNYLKGSKLLGTATTSFKHRLCISGLPYLIKRKVGESVGENIALEVYAIDQSTLSNIDLLEGHPTFYKRELTSIVMDDGGSDYVWLYKVDESYDNGIYHQSYGDSVLPSYQQSYYLSDYYESANQPMMDCTYCDTPCNDYICEPCKQILNK